MANIEPNLPAFLTERELSSYLNVPLRTVQNWRARGVGPPHVKIAGSVRYEFVRVRDHLDKQECRPVSSRKGDRR